MKKDRCIINELAQFISQNKNIKAVWLDAARKKVSFAFEDGLESQESKKQLLEIVSQHKPDENSQCVQEAWHVDCQLCERGTNQPLPENVQLVKIPDAGILLEKKSSFPPDRPVRWHQSHWVHLRPRQFTLPSELTTLTGWKKQLSLAIVCGLAALVGLILEKNLSLEVALYPTVLYVIAYLAGAFYPMKRTGELLRKGILDIDFLMLCVAVGAAFIGHWWEGATLLFLFSLSGALEEMAMANTEREIKSLFKEAPKLAVVIDSDGQEKQINVEALTVGMLLRVRPGEQFPVDCEVIHGASAANEANLTGESLPVDKKPGDTVFSGTLNLWGSVECRVSRLASESILSRIIGLIKQAQESKAPSQRFTDKFSTGYTYAILGLSFMMFFVWWLGLGIEPFNAAAGHSSAFYRAMTLLVVASPCALVLSIPSAILAGIAAGARRGVLFRGGVAIEKLAEIRRIALDKTGTLTTGDLKVIKVQSFPPGKEDDILKIAASLGHHSAHPVSKAIVKSFREKNNDLWKVDDFKSLVGLGLEGVIHRPDNTRQKVILGRRSAFDGHEWLRQIPLPDVGVTETVIEVDGLKGQIFLTDQVREASAPLLRKLGRKGIKVAMLTGDRAEAAHLIADHLGIKEVYSGMKPEEKVEKIKQWMKAGEKVAMVGDGVNDAPSLAAAHVAVGMGVRGSDAVLEQSDIVLMQDRLDNFYFAFTLSQRARRVINQNLFISLGVIVLLVASALGSVIPLTIGVIGHEGSTVVVVLNSLRLLIDRSLRSNPAG